MPAPRRKHFANEAQASFIRTVWVRGAQHYIRELMDIRYLFIVYLLFVVPMTGYADDHRMEKAGAETINREVAYHINEQEVDEKTFIRFLDTLKEVAGTRYSWGMSVPDGSGGGETGFQAKGRDGVIYNYKESVSSARL